MPGAGIRTDTTTNEAVLNGASLQILPRIGWAEAYRLRWKRRRLLLRSWRSRHQLTCRNDQTHKIKRGDILAFTTLRNEITRLPWFLHHYRQLGVDHFLIVDNGSDDRSTELLLDQPDVSLWQTHAGYRASHYGLDWLTWLQMRHGHGHWCLMVDADELLIYAHHQAKTLHDLTAWLDQSGRRAYGALMLDLYPKGALGDQGYDPATDPTDVLNWFDAAPYRAQRQSPLGNLWVQGGVRERMFFKQTRQRSPTLNKIPLVRWSRHYAYVNSCHSALPRQLNAAYDGPGGETPSGVLLHTKFLPEIIQKSRIEKQRRQHFHDPDQFGSYYDGIIDGPTLWTAQSVPFEGWEQLEQLGLMNAGGWQP